MITIPVVVGSIIVVFAAAIIFIFAYNRSLKNISPKIQDELNNTDIFIASGLDEIKIICK